MRRRTMMGLAGALALAWGLSAATQAAGQAPLVQHTFEKDAGDWQGLGTTAKISITHDAANVKEGKGALQFDYAIKNGEVNALLLPTPDGALTKMKSLHFWIKTDHATSALISLAEKDGGRYNAVITIAPNAWQRVELAPSDFQLGEDANDPKDPDGKLDLDKIENISLVDAGVFLAQFPEQLQQALGAPLGAHTLYLDDFEVNETSLIPAPAPADGSIDLTPFLRPQLDFLSLGEATVKQVTEKPLSGPSVKVTYHQSKGKITGLIKAVGKGKLANAKQLNIALASVKATTLVVQVEEVGGGKYKTMIQTPGGSELKEFFLSFSDFTRADDATDTKDKLDLKLVNKLLIIDASGFGDVPDQENTLWFNKVRATK